MRATSHRAGEAGDFAFTAETMAEAEKVMARYPEGRRASATLALLDLAQRQNGGWLPGEAIEYVANLLDLAPIRVHEVASFYTMFNKAPVGRHFVQVCTTTPCWLCGSDDITRACLDSLGIGLGETTEDGAFTVVEVECLGACVNAPMMQINDDYFEDLDAGSTEAVLDALKNGEAPETGPQSDRKGCEPAGGLTSLTEIEGGGA